LFHRTICRKYIIKRLIHDLFHIIPAIFPRPISALDCVLGWYGGLWMIPGLIWKVMYWSLLKKNTKCNLTCINLTWSQIGSVWFLSVRLYGDVLDIIANSSDKVCQWLANLISTFFIYIICIEWVSDCCLTPTQKFFRYCEIFVFWPRYSFSGTWFMLSDDKKLTT
jgi:hypothetical protein